MATGSMAVGVMDPRRVAYVVGSVGSVGDVGGVAELAGLWAQVDHDDSTPPYEQVRLQLAAAVQDGRLGAGTRLPTVRRLAGDLGLAVNTVARAYRELEQGGFVVTRGRQGTFVAAQEPGAHERGVAAARSFAAEIRLAGIDPGEALRLAREALS
ncbi:MAG: GntR family transcriptional regulator [Actinomycetes bacterium]